MVSLIPDFVCHYDELFSDFSSNHSKSSETIYRRHVEPLENNLFEDEPINITQLDKLRKKSWRSAQQKGSPAANAILEHKAKIAHNIRSLVQTSSLYKGLFKENCHPQKLLFNDVVEGIGDILTEFSTKTPPKASVNYSTEKPLYKPEGDKQNRSKIIISEVVKSVVNQKRFELKSKTQIIPTCKCSSDLTYTLLTLTKRVEVRSIHI